ncbi:dual specificity protein phosphatase 3 [Aspergillus ellipticus CBS 707.79]|uniref:Dual specificity protein phosphatase 3 n=1 Tax=Aspergillus ellipticus CBS 707.79 TaxID=1448320 RepID=A0A319ECQ2_9EURO|nr:dual specificity protein phosphatase 3 [Aspergillus ellipticus CBS 707.79]
MAPSEVPMSQRADAQYTPTHQYISGRRLPQQSTYTGVTFEGIDFGLSEGLTPTPHQFQEGEFVPPGFFDKVDPALFQLPVREVEWSYEKRRNAQQILPCLHLGPWSCLSERSWLNREGFTLLLAVRDRRLAMARLISGQKAAADLGVEADSIDIEDSQQLITALPHAIRRINEHIFSSVPFGLSMSPRKKVIVFCETGNGWSALLVVAYMMVMFNIGVSQAIHIVQSQRFCLDLDDSSTQLLSAFEAILNAKRDVEKAKQTASRGFHFTRSMERSKKRGMSEIDGDGDLDIDMVNMAEGQNHDRKPSAPFQDRSD